jgi:hypothetical protein
VPRYFAKYNTETSSWEVFDTVANKALESFSCGQDEELRHYAENRALAHANRKNQALEKPDAEPPEADIQL